jgi:hypothetical protein
MLMTDWSVIVGGAAVTVKKSLMAGCDPSRLYSAVSHITALNTMRAGLFNLCRLLALVGVAVLTSCAGVGGPPTVILTTDEIERLVQRQFPMDKRMLEIFDVNVKAPRISLLPERNRLGAVVDMRAKSILFVGSWSGQLKFDSALRWEPTDQSVRLSQVRVQDLAIDNTDALTRSAAERMGAAVAERMLEDMSLYTLPAERAAQMQALGLRPAGVNVTSRGIQVQFEALPK